MLFQFKMRANLPRVAADPALRGKVDLYTVIRAQEGIEMAKKKTEK